MEEKLLIWFKQARSANISINGPILRGKPLEIFSDGGTNFVGADREIKGMMSQIASDEKMHKNLTDEMIVWKFNPPSTPHFGGLWEAGIKQMKII